MISAVQYCPNCKSVLTLFVVEGTYEGITACTVCHKAYIPKDFGKYTEQVKEKNKK